MSLQWLNDSGMSGMGSEWMNQVLSLYKRQHLIHSFRGHSCSFRSHSMGLSNHWFWMMLEWQNDSGMRGFSGFTFFLHFRKHPHFPSFGHSFIIWEWLACCGMKNNKGGISFRGHSNHFHLFSHHSSQFHHSRMTRNDRMRVKWGLFFEAGQNP